MDNLLWGTPGGACKVVEALVSRGVRVDYGIDILIENI